MLGGRGLRSPPREPIRYRWSPHARGRTHRHAEHCKGLRFWRVHEWGIGSSRTRPRAPPQACPALSGAPVPRATGRQAPAAGTERRPRLHERGGGGGRGAAPQLRCPRLPGCVPLTPATFRRSAARGDRDAAGFARTQRGPEAHPGPGEEPAVSTAAALRDASQAPRGDRSPEAGEQG